VTANEKTAKLKVPLDFRAQRVGRILVTDFDAGRARELDARGNVLWSSPRIPGAWGCQGLANGHRLVCSFQQRYVVEYDENNKEIWRSDGKLPFYPTTVQRLYNGNTLVSGRELDDRHGVVVEIGRDGKIDAESRVRMGYKPYDLRMLDNGRLLAACTYDNLVCQFERDGIRIERTVIGGLARPETARPVGDGHFLVIDNGGRERIVTDRLRGVRRSVRPGRILEYDENFRLVSTTTNEAGELRDAERLDNGNLLILDTESIREQTPDGQVVWSKAHTGGKRLSVY
jgi:hypothetical protein